MTQEEYDNKREELVEGFVMDFDDDDVIALHNAYCECNSNYDDMIQLNNECNFDEAMGGKSSYSLAMELETGDYKTGDEYFIVGVHGPVSFDGPYDEKSPVCLGDILRRGADDVMELMDDAGIDHGELDEELEALESAFVKAQFKADWEKMCSEKAPMFEFPNGHYCYINYDEDLDTLETGSVCNAGFCLTEDTVEMKIDYDFDLSENLESLYEQIIEEHPEYEDED